MKAKPQHLVVYKVQYRKSVCPQICVRVCVLCVCVYVSELSLCASDDPLDTGLDVVLSVSQVHTWVPLHHLREHGRLKGLSMYIVSPVFTLMFKLILFTNVYIQAM